MFLHKKFPVRSELIDKEFKYFSQTVRDTFTDTFSRMWFVVKIGNTFTIVTQLRIYNVLLFLLRHFLAPNIYHILQLELSFKDA